MGVRIFVGTAGNYYDEEQAVLFCSETDSVFGPFFESREEAEMFLEWSEDACKGDARTQDAEGTLRGNVVEYREAREKGWKTKSEREYDDMVREKREDAAADARYAKEMYAKAQAYLAATQDEEQALVTAQK